MKKKSDFMTIGGADLLNALYHAIVASAIPFAGFLSAGRMPTHSEWYIILGATISAFIGALGKRGATNSQGELFTKEPVPADK